MDTSQEAQSKFVSGIYTVERADIFRQVASGYMGEIAVSVLDPANPVDADNFAMLIAREEQEFYDSGKRYSGHHFQPRSPEAIKKEVVSHALASGMVLVVIEHKQNDLSDFWERTHAFGA